MCIAGCGGTWKSQLICALSKYFLVKERVQKMRKLAPTVSLVSGLTAKIWKAATDPSCQSEDRKRMAPCRIPPVRRHEHGWSELTPETQSYHLLIQKFRSAESRSCQMKKKFNNVSLDRSSCKSIVWLNSLSR